MLCTHRIELSEEAEHPLHAAEARPLAGRGRVVAVLDGLGGRVEAGQALALLQHALVSRLEEAVGHLFGFVIVGRGREWMDEYDIEEWVSRPYLCATYLFTSSGEINLRLGPSVVNLAECGKSSFRTNTHRCCSVRVYSPSDPKPQIPSNLYSSVTYFLEFHMIIFCQVFCRRSLEPLPSCLTMHTSGLDKQILHRKPQKREGS